MNLEVQQQADEELVDEVVERDATDDELDAYATEAVPRAVDPPRVQLGMAELIGLDLPARKVIVPLWAKSWANLRFVAWWCVRYAASVVTFHLVRSPRYAVRAAVRSVVGAWVALAAFWAWLWDLQGWSMARAARHTADQQAWAKARKEWRETVHRRWIGTAVAAVLTAAALAVTWTWAPPWAVALVLVAAVGALVHVGAPEEDGGLLDEYFTEKPGAPWRMTSKIVLDALGGIGLAAITAALRDDPRHGVAFVDAIAHDGPGWRVVVDLPKGVTAADVIERREKLAAGLRRPLGTVWPEGVKGTHPGRLLIYVADEDMSTAVQAQWALLRSGQVDLFRPAPLGTDQRQRPVWITLMFATMVIGAIPRMGKTFALRLCLLIAALDPRAKVLAFDKKGSGDLSPLEHVAHAYTVGDEPEDIAVDLRELRAARTEMRRRYKLLRTLPKERVPESKVTPELASDRSVRFEPWVIGVDECQVWFEHKTHGGEFEEICTDLVKRGPAAGMIPIFATQRPDAKSIPKPISDNAALRLALKVMEWGANDMILGTGQYKAGVRATMFAREDVGIAILAGEGADPRVVRIAKVDNVQAEKVALRARALRERDGTLSGYCVGDQDGAEEAPSLLDDLPRIFVESERLHSEQVIDRLQELRPGTYDGWTPTTLAGAVRDQLGIGTSQLKIAGENRQGLRRSAVLKAVEERAGVPELPLGVDDEAS